MRNAGKTSWIRILLFVLAALILALTIYFILLPSPDILTKTFARTRITPSTPEFSAAAAASPESLLPARIGEFSPGQRIKVSGGLGIKQDGWKCDYSYVDNFDSKHEVGFYAFAAATREDAKALMEQVHSQCKPSDLWNPHSAQLEGQFVEYFNAVAAGRTLTGWWRENWLFILVSHPDIAYERESFIQALNEIAREAKARKSP